MLFPLTPKPRELTELEIDEFGLRQPNGDEMKYSIETTDKKWRADMTDTDPVYRFYLKGVDGLFILKFNWLKDIWEEIKYTEIEDMQGLLWLMCLRLQSR